MLGSAHPEYSYHLSPYNAVAISLNIFFMLCLLSPWFIRSITGGLYLPLLFTCFAHPPSLLREVPLMLLLMEVKGRGKPAFWRASSFGFDSPSALVSINPCPLFSDPFQDLEPIVKEETFPFLQKVALKNFCFCSALLFFCALGLVWENEDCLHFKFQRFAW